MEKRNWKDYGTLLALAVVWGICAAANTGMAWFDYGIVLPINVAATGLYIVTGTGVALLSRKKPARTRRMRCFSWLSLICCLVCWYCSLEKRAWGLLFAPLAAIPFYGLRMWCEWEGTYLCGAAISLGWIAALFYSGQKDG